MTEENGYWELLKEKAAGKETDHPKHENVLIFSAICCFKPVCLFLHTTSTNHIYQALKEKT